MDGDVHGYSESMACGGTFYPTVTIQVWTYAQNLRKISSVSTSVSDPRRRYAPLLPTAKFI
jgi:hypothetical protein